MSGLITKEDRILHKKAKECPIAWEWILHKAKWEKMCIMAVVNEYKGTIENLIENGDTEGLLPNKDE